MRFYASARNLEYFFAAAAVAGRLHSTTTTGTVLRAYIHYAVQPLPPLYYTYAVTPLFVFPLCTHALANPTNILISRYRLFFFCKKNVPPPRRVTLNIYFRVAYDSSSLRVSNRGGGGKNEKMGVRRDTTKDYHSPRSAVWWCWDRVNDIMLYTYAEIIINKKKK